MTCIFLLSRLRNGPMNEIKAIGFDLFNTLLTVEAKTLETANNLLFRTLLQSGVNLDEEQFRKSYREAAMRFLEECRRDGTETHNRFWISAALQAQSFDIFPDDPLIASAVEAYFSAFYDRCHLIPGTREMLGTLKRFYRLGLLSNFTHGPAVRKIIDHLGLRPFFDVVLISGELGYRKPHPMVFRKLVEGLGVESSQILYVGDDVGPDIVGARRSGLQPVWASYVQDHHIPYGPGILSRDTATPDSGVPRISNWDDLLSLIHMST